MNPIFTADSSPTRFADHLQAVTDAVSRVLRGGDVPELVLASINEHRATLTPWMPGAPVTGLLRWADHLTDPSWTAVVHEPLDGSSRSLISLYVVGRLSGMDVELVGTSYRDLPGLDWSLYGRQQPVDPDLVRELGAREQPIDLTPEAKP